MRFVFERGSVSGKVHVAEQYFMSEGHFTNSIMVYSIEKTIGRNLSFFLKTNPNFDISL